MKLILVVIILITGCSSLLPSEEVQLSDKHTSFDKVKEKYDNIVLGQTKYACMVDMGFDPYSQSNVEILSYTDMILKFMPSDNILVSDLPDGIQQCIQEKEKCLPYVVEFGETNKDRIGNATLDLFGFVEETETTGWNFNALFIMIDNVVVYKIFQGNPNKYEYRKKDRPLGPLQKLGDAIIRDGI